MATDKLTELAVKKAKPRAKAYRLFDGNGMYLEVRPSGAKWWRHKFRFGGKEKLLSLGVYPEVTLAEARSRRAKARDLLAQGIDPSVARRTVRHAGTGADGDSFESVARELYSSRESSRWGAAHAERWMQRMVLHVFPYIGAQHINAIAAPDLLRIARRVESRGALETARTVIQHCGQVFRYGIATGRCDRNPSPDLRDALKPVVVQHMAALTEPRQVGALLRAIDDYQGAPITRSALILSALWFQRPGNVRAAEWSEFDLGAAMWSIPSAKMKRTLQAKVSGRPHLVPLSTQALAELRVLEKMTGGGRYLFPSLLSADRCMSENTVNTALRRMGYGATEMTAHGFRATARTILVEKLDINPDVVEAQLAHKKSGPLGSAYDRAEFMDQRVKMMQKWADYLDRLREGAEVVPMRAA